MISDGTPFEALLTDGGFRASTLDDDFALAAYATFAQGRFRDAGELRFMASWREAAGFVADARGKGESYLDFYERQEGDPGDGRIASALATHGWRALTADEIVEEHDGVVAMVRLAATKPLGTHPSEWAVRLVSPADTRQGTAALRKNSMVKVSPKGLWDVARFAAFDGKLSRAEWKRFASRWAFDVERLRPSADRSTGCAPPEMSCHPQV